jgi:hypothetical protein
MVGTTTILSKSQDWQRWYHLIKTGAINAEIWEYVNPDTTEASLPKLTAPIEPTVSSVRDTATSYDNLDDNLKLQLRDLKESFKRHYKEYREKKVAIANLVKRIQETVDERQHYLLEDLTDPYSMLVALKERLSPTQKIRERDTATAYKKLLRAPHDSDLEDWLVDWQITYTKAKALNLPEVHGDRASIDLLNALESIDVHFAENQLAEVQKCEDTGETCADVPTLLNRYENRRRIKQTSQKTNKQQPAFATLRGRTSKFESKDKYNEGTSAKGNSRINTRKPPGPCLCGADHFYSACYYIIKSIRPTNWHPKMDLQRKVDDSIRNDPKLQETIEGIKARLAEKSQPFTPNDPPVAMAVSHQIGEAYATMPSTANYRLRNSIILDSACDIHVCNTRERLIDLTDSETNDYLIAGDTTVPILGYGTTIVKARTPDNKNVRTLHLHRTAYAPTFHTSLLSLRTIMKKGFKWAIDDGLITNSSGPVCRVLDMFNQWVIEYNPVQELSHDSEPEVSSDESELQAFATTKKSRKPLVSTVSKDIWHQRFGHISMEAVGHIPTALNGVKITNTPVDRSGICETCAVANLQAQVSRRPAQRADKPFERVHFDLVQVNPAFNGHQWGMHFLCDKTRVHFGYTFASKIDARDTVKTFTAFVLRQYKVDILIWHTDGEKALTKKEFGDWLHDEGFTYETTAPDTPSQNGPSERSGGVIMARARAMRIEAKLPANLWPELFNTAIYITNRTPTKQLGWLTPLEVLHRATDRSIANPQPSGAHIRTIGSRVYGKIQHVPKKQKVGQRSLIGYLVGYDSTNIFRVWVPQKKRILRLRDVKIDETKRYDPDNPYIEDLLKESIPGKRVILDIPELESRNQSDPFGIDESSTDEDEVESSTSQDPEQDAASTDVDAQDAPEDPSSPLAQFLLPTPSDTPTPMPTRTPSLAQGELDKDNTGVDLDPEEHTSRRTRASKEIVGDVGDPRNIASGPRRPRQRREAYLAELATPENFPGFFSAFSAGIVHSRRIHRDDLPPPPKNWKELLTHPHKEGFIAAANKEIQELTEKETFKYVKRPQEAQVIPMLWTFLYKLDSDGYLIKYKARLCVRGDMQRLTLKDTYAATLAAKVFRAIMAMVAIFDLDATQGDVQNAFVHSELDETVYCACPDGFRVPGMCIQLLKALYGLRRAPRLWFQNFVKKLNSLGFRQLSEEPCLFANDFMIIIFFVDDSIYINHPDHREQAKAIKQALMESYDFKDLGDIKWFLGVRVLRDRPNRKLWLCQDSYIDKISHRFNLQPIKPPKTPMTTDQLAKNPGTALPQEIHLYQQKVGSLLYATTITRPDTARTANKLSEFLTNPSKEHLDAVDRAISYLYGTKFLAIEYSRESEGMLCASDAAFADNIDDRKSTEGYLVMLFGGPIDWRASKQKTVTTSTTEAELLALSHTTKDFYWWRRLLNNIGLDLDDDGKTPILCDNMQTIRLIETDEPKFRTQLKHIDVHNHWLRQELRAHHIRIQWIPTADMPADGFTKALTRQRHDIFIKSLNLINIRNRIDSDADQNDNY